MKDLDSLGSEIFFRACEKNIPAFCSIGTLFVSHGELDAQLINLAKCLAESGKNTSHSPTKLAVLLTLAVAGIETDTYFGGLHHYSQDARQLMLRRIVEVSRECDDL